MSGQWYELVNPHWYEAESEYDYLSPWGSVRVGRLDRVRLSITSRVTGSVLRCEPVTDPATGCMWIQTVGRNPSFRLFLLRPPEAFQWKEITSEQATRESCVDEGVAATD